MQTVSITEAKNKLSALLSKVRAGESILILDRGVPVARIEPVAPADDEGKVARLERLGIIRAGHGSLPPGFTRAPLPTPSGGRSIVDLVLEERESRW